MGSSFGHPCSNTEPRPGWTSHWMRPPECDHARPVGKPAGQHAHSGETAKHSLRPCTLRTVEDNGIRLIFFNIVVQLFHRNLPIAGFFFGGGPFVVLLCLCKIVSHFLLLSFPFYTFLFHSFFPYEFISLFNWAPDSPQVLRADLWEPGSGQEWLPAPACRTLGQREREWTMMS